MEEPGDMLRVGVICNTHGVHGEVKIYPTTDDLQRFDDLKEAYIDTGKTLVHVDVVGVKYFKGQAILKFKQFDNLNDVEKFKQKDLLVARDQAVELSDGEYFVSDILGMEVYEKDGSLIGTLTDVLETGANDVYVVTKAEDKKEILVPAIKECIVSVSTEENRMVVNLLPGLV